MNFTFISTYKIICFLKRSKVIAVSANVFCVTIQMKATEQYFLMVLFIMLYKECSNFEAVDEIINQVS